MSTGAEKNHGKILDIVNEKNAMTTMLLTVLNLKQPIIKKMFQASELEEML
jgi:hypothetical protein